MRRAVVIRTVIKGIPFDECRRADEVGRSHQSPCSIRCREGPIPRGLNTTGILASIER
jgi:hypothetical protein